MNNRAIVIILDSLGIGKMPDAREFGDDNPNTLLSISEGGINIPNLLKLGMARIDGVEINSDRDEKINCAYARLKEKSHAKDTITGHWEMMGIISTGGFNIYPNGFPDELMNAIKNECGFEFLGNCPASGTEIIKQLGEEHVKTKKPIAYTSADSVFQIAAHEEVIPLEKLYDLCKNVRRIADEGNYGIGRIIARPFLGSDAESFKRTENRRDFSVTPPDATIMDRLCELGKRVLAIGKIEDIFANRGITVSDHSKNNEQGIDAVIKHMKAEDSDFIFANLVDFDMLYGHRRDVTGYKKALEHFDNRLPEIISCMREGDMLIITADHGCDPKHSGTDHTREYVPMLSYTYGMNGELNLGTINGFDYIGKTVFRHVTQNV